MKVEEYYKNFTLNASKNSVNDLIAHSEHVERLAVNVFEELLSLHFVDKKFQKDLKLLKHAAKLHDIGTFIETEKKHNKIGAKLILKNKIDGLNKNENEIVANIVRFHRGKTPKEKHKIYNDLDKISKEKVLIFAGILRIADVLDYNHFSTCGKVMFKKDKKREILYILDCSVALISQNFEEAFAKKKKLLENVLGLKILIKKNK